MSRAVRQEHKVLDGPNGPITIQLAGRYTCPFCDHKRHFDVGFMNGDEDTGTPVILHETPACKTFVKASLLDFLQFARRAGARPFPEPS